MKNVIFWEPKRSEKLKNDGTPFPLDYVGKFRTKSTPGAPGARNYKGRLANGKEYDYWGIDVDSVAGKIRWIDKQDNGEYGTNMVLFLESEKYLHKITVRYDPYNLKDVLNHLCGMGKEVGSRVINISYWVRKAQNQDKSYKVNESGEPIWNKSLSFRDISPQFTFEQWKDFAQTNGLEWTQVKRANGKKEWNSDAEYKYWDGRLVGIQRFLLSEGIALPFSYNSMTVCEAPNPSGGGNLNSEEIERCKEIYEQVKSDYKFPFSKNLVNADDAFEQVSHTDMDARVAYIESAIPMPHPDTVLIPNQAAMVGGNNPFPTYAPPSGSEFDGNDSDLPF